MTSTNIDGTVLKSDSRGRVRVPAQRREALLDEFERSGLSGMKFAALAGVKYPTFAYWLSKRRKAGVSGSSESAGVGRRQAEVSRVEKSVRLFEAFAEVGKSSSGSGLRIELPGGANLVVDSPSQLSLAAGLLQMLNHGRRSEC